LNYKGGTEGRVLGSAFEKKKGEVVSKEKLFYRRCRKAGKGGGKRQILSMRGGRKRNTKKECIYLPRKENSKKAVIGEKGGKIWY